MNPSIFIVGCDPADVWPLCFVLFLCGVGVGIFLAALVTMLASLKRPS